MASALPLKPAGKVCLSCPESTPWLKEAEARTEWGAQRTPSLSCLLMSGSGQHPTHVLVGVKADLRGKTHDSRFVCLVCDVKTKVPHRCCCCFGGSLRRFNFLLTSHSCFVSLIRGPTASHFLQRKEVKSVGCLWIHSGQGDTITGVGFNLRIKENDDLFRGRWVGVDVLIKCQKLLILVLLISRLSQIAQHWSKPNHFCCVHSFSCENFPSATKKWCFHNEKNNNNISGEQTPQHWPICGKERDSVSQNTLWVTVASTLC